MNKPTLEQHIDAIAVKENCDPVDFFLGWNVSPAIIAKRLRNAGLAVDSKEITRILKEGIKTREQRSLLYLAMVEMKLDIMKVIYSK